MKIMQLPLDVQDGSYVPCKATDYPRNVGPRKRSAAGQVIKSGTG